MSKSLAAKMVAAFCSGLWDGLISALSNPWFWLVAGTILCLVGAYQILTQGS